MPARTRRPLDVCRALGVARGPRLACALLLVLGATGCRKQPADPAREGDGTAAPAAADGGSTATTPGAVPGPVPGDAAATTTATATDGTTDGGDVAPGEVLPAIFLSRKRTTSFVGGFLLPDSRPVDAVWQPTRDDFDRLLAGLPARLEADRDRRGSVVATRLRQQLSGEPADAAWDRYGVQVVGVVSGERRLVYANFYCNPGRALRDQPEELVMVLDGGTCYFQVWFDVSSGEYPRVVINGEA
jgi:hypothetical protein